MGPPDLMRLPGEHDIQEHETNGRMTTGELRDAVQIGLMTVDDEMILDTGLCLKGFSVTFKRLTFKRRGNTV